MKREHYKTIKKRRLRNKKLCKQYPFLIPRCEWTGKILEDYDYSFTEYNRLENGWQIGFGKIFLQELKEALLKTNYLNRLRIYQLKEKYGSLRCYTNSVPNEVQEVLDKFEFISQYVCDNCGSPHAIVVDCYGWYLPKCKKCWEKLNKRYEKFGCRNLKSYEEAGGNSSTTIPTEYTVTRYSKGEETTVTYDISSTVDRINHAYERRERKKHPEKFGDRQDA